MMRFAVCDRQPVVTGQIDSLIVALSSARGQRFEVAVFFSCESFCRHIRETGAFFDIVIMDAEELGPDGPRFGECLRESLKNSRSLLFLTTERPSYHNRVIDLNVFSIIQKPIANEEFAEKLDMAVRKAERQRLRGAAPDLIVKKNRRELHIPASSILYLESDIRQIHLRAETEVVTYYGILTEEEEKLPAGLFTRIHKSYLINFAHIADISAKEVEMKDGRKLSISGRYRESVKAAYRRYKEEAKF
jgi:DNA-binding LytR/AlgR family response regulator